jgi:SAM-dependent methyltransferase
LDDVGTPDDERPKVKWVPDPEDMPDVREPKRTSKKPTLTPETSAPHIGQKSAEEKTAVVESNLARRQLNEGFDVATAFGRAMLATINGRPQRFRMSMQDGRSMEMDCRDFLNLRQEEVDLLDRIALPDHGNALDWGCGVGRHLAHVRRRFPSVRCCGIDICDLMLNHCRQAIAAPATFARSFDALPDKQFDLIMLIGNGLGVFGCEKDAAASLRILVQSLRPEGHIVIETGNLFGSGYFSAPFVIDYREHRDGPFTWGYSDRGWISQKLQELGCVVAIEPSNAPGGIFFFAVARRTDQRS